MPRRLLEIEPFNFLNLTEERIFSEGSYEVQLNQSHPVVECEGSRVLLSKSYPGAARMEYCSLFIEY